VNRKYTRNVIDLTFLPKMLKTAFAFSGHNFSTNGGLSKQYIYVNFMTFLTFCDLDLDEFWN